MILAIGEILADMVGKEVGGVLQFDAFCGGAPFNVAVNAKQNGAKVGFIGKVGKDPIGNYLKESVKKVGFDYLDIQTDKERNTTLAFVTLIDGERDFAFNRHDTADFNIDIDKVNLSVMQDLNIVHLGSLMLSEKAGIKFAKSIVKKVKKSGKLLSFDLNFRKDIFEDFSTAIKAYKPFINSADIIKFSEEEVFEYTGIEDLDSAIDSIYRENTIVLVTLGKKGCKYYYNGQKKIIDENTFSGKLVDTTGAGDAFFGTFLANVEGKEISIQVIEEAIKKANLVGGLTTQFLGAVKF